LPPATTLVSLLHHEPPLLLVAQLEFSRRSGFGRLLIPRLNRPEVLPALSDDRDAPAPQLGGGGLLSRGLSCRNHVAWSRRKALAAIEIAWENYATYAT
jgi:hypothetical protein